MADNFTITPGAGATVGADEVTIAGTPVLAQFVKLLDATDNSVNRLIINSDGSMQVNPVGVSTAIKQTALSVTAAVALPAAALANRRSLLIVNNSATVTLYIGATGVTTADGLPIGPGGSVQIDAGPTLTVYGVTGSACDVRILEIA